MSQFESPDGRNDERPAEASVDEQTQREIDEALGEGSLEDLMEKAAEAASATPANLDGPQRGQVVAIHGEDVFVDLGGKTQGVVPASQFEEGKLPGIGEIIKVLVQGYDEQEGMLQLTRQGAVQAAAWDTLELGQVVEGMVTGVNKGGLELKINSLRGFMPASHVDTRRIDDLTEMLNQKLQGKVIECNPRDKKLVVSRRQLLLEEEKKLAAQTWETLEVGQTVSGTVKTIMPYGAFVDIGGVDGLLHIGEMSHGHIDKPEDIVRKGQQLDVQVIKVDPDKKKISLSLKSILADPWEGAEHKWPPDSIISGRVTRLADFGAFVELEPGVEGLIPNGELVYGRRINHPREVLNQNDTVKVRVLRLEPDRKRISLSLKQTEEDPWTGASVRFAPGSVVEGNVSRVADFGAFVELAKGVEGLVHISELASHHVNSVRDVCREGDLVQVKVLDVDEGARRIGLSIKQASEEQAMEKYVEMQQQERQQSRRKRKRPLKGGLD
jgi:small subunit ribosomal protein S1